MLIFFAFAKKHYISKNDDIAICIVFRVLPLLTLMTTAKELNDYLKVFNISDRRYLVGVFQEGVTVYKQQVRSLNILYALIESNKLKKGDTIGIIGGGVAGLTIASAALRSGLKVKIMEQKQIYLHVQYGCETRKIHPNIYEWPSKESLFTYADIPVLSWKYDTAANVSKQLFSGFSKIAQEFKDNIKEIKSCTIKNIVETADHVEVDWENDENDTSYFDILIYATGYGIEEGVDSDKHMISYWRNDDFSQLSMPKKKQEYIISGVGDGGLIDLFRLKIFGFTIDSIIKDLKSDETNYTVLVERLIKIQEDWVSQQYDNNKDKWLFNQFQKLNTEGLLEYLKRNLLTKRRNENEVILNSNIAEFKSVLNLNKISMLNALIAYTLFTIKGFEYKCGECHIKDNKTVINSSPIPDSTITIFRHGTDRKNILKEVFLSDTEIENLSIKQKNNYTYNIVERIWPFGWWSSRFPPKENDGYKPFIEFYTPDTESICAVFVSALSSVLQHFHSKISKSKKDFRVTLHRIVNINKEYFFQQITPYYGTREIGEVGRVFPIAGGTAGFTARTGKTVIMERKNDAEFDELIKDFEFSLTKARILSKNVSSLLTMPIFGSFGNGNLATNLIIYIDSSDSDFFEKDSDIIPLLTQCTNGFIDSINNLIQKGNVTMGELSFEPKSISPEEALQQKLEANSCYKDLSAKSSYNLSPQDTPLKFTQFHSFNIITAYEHDPFQQY